MEHDLKSKPPLLNEAVDVAQNRPLWRLCLRLALRTPSGACQKRRRRRMRPVLVFHQDQLTTKSRPAGLELHQQESHRQTNSTCTSHQQTVTNDATASHTPRTPLSNQTHPPPLQYKYISP